MCKLLNLGDNYNYIMYVEEYNTKTDRFTTIGKDKVTMDLPTDELFVDYNSFKILMIDLMQQVAKNQDWIWTYYGDDDDDDTIFFNEEMEVHTSFIVGNKEHILKFTFIEEKYLID